MADPQSAVAIQRYNNPITLPGSDPGRLWDEDGATLTVNENIWTIFLPMIIL